MKRIAILTLATALSASSLALAQSTEMQGRMGMKDADMKKCMEMMGMKDMDMKGMDMKGMDMKGMDAAKCKEMMKADPKHSATPSKSEIHQADAIVKKIDVAQGKVTLAHGPVKSMGWPAMTMGFVVKDKALFDKLTVDKKVQVEFKKENADHVITAVK